MSWRPPDELDEFEVQLGATIRFHRQTKGLTTSELAEMIDIKSPTLRRMELGQWLINVRVLIRVSLALEITMDELIPYKAKQLAKLGPATRRSGDKARFPVKPKSR